MLFFYYVSIIIMYTPFWTDKMEILYDRNYIFEIFPTKDFDLIRKLNAIFRFSIYYALIIYFYNRNTNIFYIPIVVGLVTYFVFKKNGLTHIDTIKTDLRNAWCINQNIPLHLRIRLCSLIILSTNKPMLHKKMTGNEAVIVNTRYMRNKTHFKQILEMPGA